MESVLHGAFERVSSASVDKRALEPAADWLADNFYLLEQQLHEVRAGLAARRLPRLPLVRGRDEARVPRVLALLRELVVHADGNVPVALQQKFIKSYQGADCWLTVAELQVLPIMLRLAVFEYFAPIAAALDARLQQSAAAAEAAATLTAVARDHPADLVEAVAGISREVRADAFAWIAEFHRRVQSSRVDLRLVRVWLAQRLAVEHGSIEAVFAAENVAQTTAQVAAGHCIGTLRRISRTDWTKANEELSIVEQTLRRDPAQVYSTMDAPTRWRYRDAVAFAAARTPLSECAVALHAVEQARASENVADAVQAHVGYWLLGRGRKAFEAKLDVRLSPYEHLWRGVRRCPSLFYLMPIALITLAAVVVGLPALADLGRFHAAAVLVALVVAVTHLGVALVNWTMSLDIEPRGLPRLNLQHGVPDRLRTLVVVPCLFSSRGEVEALLAALEIRYLGNRDANIYFALLGDHVDAAAKTLPEDMALLEAARTGIARLNARYEPDRAPRFALFVRDRLWNAAAGVWMGWERKRGKLIALNRFLRARAPEDFHLLVGDEQLLRGVVYVITLDADTELPPQAARRLIATLAHPLNRAVWDEKCGRVTAGYGVLQPRVSVGASRTGASRLALLYSTEIALDPYTGLVSDVYQDLFGESSFIGKGIYAVDVFMRAVGDRFPENAILSHDLLEGSYARTGLVSDVELYEYHPQSYATDMKRRERWIRGDWQIGHWLLPWVPAVGSAAVRNPLSAHQRWKVLDNLRRSLVPVALLVLLLHGWLADSHPGYWLVFVLAIVFAPPLIASARQMEARPPRMRWRLHWRMTAETGMRSLLQAAISLIMLPFEAVHALTAIARSLWRRMVSHSRLLQWTPASAVARSAPEEVPGFYRLMWSAPAIALLTAAALPGESMPDFWSAAPLLVLWAAAPAIAWGLSRPATHPSPAALTPAQRAWFGTVARRTWDFFVTFTRADEHFLTPDNFQEYPHPMTAHRTSPTNIGMYLTAVLSAADFGYITRTEVHQRAADTLATLERLQRFHGHFLNWYDTQTLAPLPPAYVSTVDSGNLVSALMVVARGLEEAGDEHLLPPQAWRGLVDTWRVFAAAFDPDSGTRSRLDTSAEAALAAIGRQLARAPAAEVTLSQQRRALEALQERIGAALAGMPAARAETPQAVAATEPATGKPAATESGAARPARAAPEDACEWLRRLQADCAAWLAELTCVAPWAAPGTVRNALPAAVLAVLDANPTAIAAHAALDALFGADGPHPEAGTSAVLTRARQVLCDRLDQAAALAMRCRALCTADFTFLFDPAERLLAIGYNVDTSERDASVYDLLASESRLASYAAIALGQLSPEHWLAFSRLLTPAGEGVALVSWTGTMFEYLMPLLFMPGFENTLLTRTCRNVIEQQIRYGAARGVPWGISESAYNTTDAHYAYQYRAFGVPDLGLKRGLARDLVVAPYATALAAMLRPRAACDNLQRLARMGALGRYGFYEALDFTPARLPAEAEYAVVRTYMAHHQGMAFTALASVLNGPRLQQRFLREPQFRAYKLLLQEKIPAAVSIEAGALHMAELRAADGERAVPARTIRRLDNQVPRVQLLSNGRYHVMVTAAGGGYSRWNDWSVNAWDGDGVDDSSGIFCYMQDLERNLLWSSTWQPTRHPPDSYEATFAQGSAEFVRRDGDMEMRTHISVSPEDDVELRRVTVTNHSGSPRRLALVSYLEWAAAQGAEALAHPVFSKLFVETEFIAASQALLATRRRKAMDERPPTFFHLMSGHGYEQGTFSHETRRGVFLGRTGSRSDPAALHGARALGDGDRTPLDPIAAMRLEFTLAPHASCTVDLVTGVAAERSAAVALAARYADRHLATRVFDLAWTHEQVLAYQLGATPEEIRTFAELAGAVLFIDPDKRTAGAPGAGQHGQSALWKYGISGDLPIVLLRVSGAAELPLARQAIKMHTWWHVHGLRADLVIRVEERPGYRQELRDRIMAIATATVGAPPFDRPGGVFVRQSDQFTPGGRELLLATACMVLDGRDGELRNQFAPPDGPQRKTPGDALIPAASQPMAPTARLTRPENLVDDNGHGGWLADSSGYQIWLEHGRPTPLPWSNVLANPTFGSVVSESGSAYTWSENAHEFRLTPWHNDPVCDTSGEAFYLRDDASGFFWSPTALPAAGPEPYRTTHGFGYSRFETIQAGVESTLTVFVAREHPLKYSVLRLRNRSEAVRRLSVYGYVEWVLGERRAGTAAHVVTQCDRGEGVIWARNAFNDAFADRAGWFAVGVPDAAGDDAPSVSATGSRSEFIGVHQTLRAPRALRQSQLGQTFGADGDPCGAWQVPLRLEPGAECELVFALGGAASVRDMHELVRAAVSADAARAELEQVQAFWRELTGRVQVRTPDAALDRMVNGWLVYQIVASRLWGRSGYYQSGGAYGFRDQLQDSMALLTLAPRFAREQILRCCAHQFERGDVQHWWHPPHGRGVRTRSSDDSAWLPWALAEYVAATDDVALLHETMPFLQGRELQPDETSYYDAFSAQEARYSVYEHGARALDHVLRLGEHGLPLMGSGDWNDGMDRVGHRGRGESVWLALFLVDVLRRYAALAGRHGDATRAARWLQQADALAVSIDACAWDGGWWRRAFADDGSVLGSAESSECQIDSLPQSWAVLAQVGSPERRQQALAAAMQRLVHPQERVIQLFDPPFDRSELDPGYIRGYIAGTRENGGQYTHAAVWLGLAQAASGRGDEAWQIFDWINPVRHGERARIATYLAEPYVVAADVYWERTHRGRGGWTWYTGSAGWLLRLGLEAILGLHRAGNKLLIAPCVPADWDGFHVTWRDGATCYEIECVRSARSGVQITLDGATLSGNAIALARDGKTHLVHVDYGAAQAGITAQTVPQQS